MNQETIQLQEFVQSALVQIMRAVSDAGPEIEKLGGKINPAPYGEGKELAQAGVARVTGGGSMGFVEFDIAVTATKGQERESKVGVLFAAVGAGMKEKNDLGNQTVSRISFRLPVKFPRTGD
jgi:hypothetical protein